MLVADLRHYLDLPDDAAGPLKALADQLTGLVRAATARPAGPAWETTIACRRRPGRRACPGRLAVARCEVPAIIRWSCTSCDDSGEISGWEHCWADLRSTQPDHVDVVDLVLPMDAARLLQEVSVFDSDGERMVRGARVADGMAILTGPPEAVEELLGCVAAEANHTPNRALQRKLDDAYTRLELAFSQLDRF